MKIRVALACAMLLGCTPSPEEAERAKIAQMEAMRREIVADLFRQKADCQAFSIEFPWNHEAIDDCRRTAERMQALTEPTLAAIDRRLALVGVMSSASSTRVVARAAE